LVVVTVELIKTASRYTLYPASVQPLLAVLADHVRVVVVRVLVPAVKPVGVEGVPVQTGAPVAVLADAIFDGALSLPRLSYARTVYE
jgi:hypothetical protein